MTKFEIIKKVPLSCEIAKLNKEYTGYGVVHLNIRGLLVRACIQVFGDTYKEAGRQSAFFLINIVKFLPLSAYGEPCKIRHYEHKFNYDSDWNYISNSICYSRL